MMAFKDPGWVWLTIGVPAFHSSAHQHSIRCRQCYWACTGGCALKRNLRGWHNFQCELILFCSPPGILTPVEVVFLSEPSLGAAASPASKALVVETCGAWSSAWSVHSAEVSVKPFQRCLAANRRDSCCLPAGPLPWRHILMDVT